MGKGCESDWRGQQLSLADFANFRHEDVERGPGVVQARGHQDDPAGARYASKTKYPKEDPVKNHRYILPVVDNL